MHKRAPIDMPFKDRLTASINETADVTSLGERKVRELIAQGRLEIAKVDKRTLVKVPSVLRLLGE